MVSKVILKNSTGNIIAVSLRIGEKTAVKIMAFDTFIQIIKGVAEIIINNKKHRLKAGKCILIPAHSPYLFLASEPFKMLTTTIKSRY